MARFLFVVVLFIGAFLRDAPTAAADAAAIYANRCAFCHGTSGQGDGPAGVGLKPAPRDLTTPAYWKTANTEAMESVVANGKPGTAMVSFKGILSPDEIAAVVEYIKTFKRSP